MAMTGRSFSQSYRVPSPRRTKCSAMAPTARKSRADPSGTRSGLMPAFSRFPIPGTYW